MYDDHHLFKATIYYCCPLPGYVQFIQSLYILSIDMICLSVWLAEPMPEYGTTFAWEDLVFTKGNVKFVACIFFWLFFCFSFFGLQVRNNILCFLNFSQTLLINETTRSSIYIKHTCISIVPYFPILLFLCTPNMHSFVSILSTIDAT